MDKDISTRSLEALATGELQQITSNRNSFEMTSSFNLSVVVPAFNEADNIPILIDSIVESCREFPSFEIIIVDDGSCDGSAAVLRNIECPHLRYVLLSRNFGHQSALRAGLAHAKGDCVVCMDADMQHPPSLLRDMVRRWQEGTDIVNCIRLDGPSQPAMKRLTSRWFYRGLSWLSGLSLVPGSSDFRLLDRKVVSILNQLPESDLFFRGIIPTLGFRVESIEYSPQDRRHGESKYTFHKMMKLALSGVISTSTRPLRLATFFAFLTALGALSFLAYVLYTYFIVRAGVAGWASTLCVALIIGTMQLLVLGVLGEYLAQVLRETRRRR